MLYLDNDAFILHNNFIKDRFGKELRFKEMKLYELDLNQEYSGIRKYITVEGMNKGSSCAFYMSTREYLFYAAYTLHHCK